MKFKSYPPLDHSCPGELTFEPLNSLTDYVTSNRNWNWVIHYRLLAKMTLIYWQINFKYNLIQNLTFWPLAVG